MQTYVFVLSSCPQSWRQTAVTREYDIQYRLLPIQLAQEDVATRFVLQNTKEVTFQEMTIPNHLPYGCTATKPFSTWSMSYTTDDLIFDWEPKVPLVVEPTIELPQHILVDTKLGDCMQEYSTGVSFVSSVLVLFISNVCKQDYCSHLLPALIPMQA
ncbi:glycine receptor subunit alpha-2 [Trichonephila inaurata madagascariensis]|uniref:Glycine receptor subunit alpha-2 n=1 Tax=Trichonephila inaurata madagascariensis TaxID=2747483 RepID=A0A8X7BTD2_9ARAC|nr:glycine receptor subunit alpha-2 [Trichonephila inaurata madagascariensis]